MQVLMTFVRVSQDLRRSRQGLTQQFHFHGTFRDISLQFTFIFGSLQQADCLVINSVGLAIILYQSLSLYCQASRSRTGGWPEFWQGIIEVNKSSQKFSEIRVQGTGLMSNKTGRIVTSADLIPPGTGSLSSRQNGFDRRTHKCE